MVDECKMLHVKLRIADDIDYHETAIKTLRNIEVDYPMLYRILSTIIINQKKVLNFFASRVSFYLLLVASFVIKQVKDIHTKKGENSGKCMSLIEEVEGLQTIAEDKNDDSYSLLICSP